MRLRLLSSFFALSALFFVLSAAQAQSIQDNLPPTGGDEVEEMSEPVKEVPPAPVVPVAEMYTITDVAADVTADNASHARDQALMQAERTAYEQLCARMGVPDNNIKLNDDALAALVQSFEVQSERVSAVRYIGVFTIRFKPAATQKRMGGKTADGSTVKTLPAGPVSHLTVSVQTDSLAAWAGIRKRLNATTPVASIDVIDLGRGISHIDLSYVGSTNDLQQALTSQGLVLRQVAGDWQLYDGSMTQR
jgi:hypothetical protein